MDEKQRAEDLLVFYMAKAWEAAGLHWEGDNDTEVRLIADNLVAAGAAEVKARADALAVRVAALEDELSRITGFTPALP